MKRVLSKDNYKHHILNDNVFGIDPVDGTSQFANDLYEWSVSIGHMHNIEHLAGAIYAPDIKDGLLVFCARGAGTYEVLENKKPKKVHVSKNKEDRKKLIFYGPDIAFMPEFNKFVNMLGQKCRTTNMVGSCALGMALVATGRIDGFFNPTQRVWDWFAGYPLIEEAGGVVKFYRIHDSKIIPVEKPLIDDYNQESKNLGFFAGNKETAEKYFSMLVEL